MRNIKRLSESDLNRIVKKVINEQSPYDGHPVELYKMYYREIESEMKNIELSIMELERMREDIMMDEDLHEDDKNDLDSLIADYLKF